MYKLTLSLLLIGIVLSINNVYAQEVREVGSLEIEGFGRDMEVLGDYAYIVNIPYEHEGEYGFQIVDISNSREPQEVAFFEVGSFSDDILVRGDYAYFPVVNEGLHIVDISNPENPEEVEFMDRFPRWIYDVELSGQFLYWSDGQFMIGVVDISDPTDPNMIENFRVQPSPIRVTVSGNYMYVANRQDFRIFTVADPESIEVVGILDEGFDELRWVDVKGEFAYVVDAYRGLFSINVSDPENPEFVGSYEFECEWIPRVIVSGNFAYVIDYREGFRIVDISDPENLEEVGFYELTYIWDLCVSGNLVYVTSLSDRCLHIFDISSFLDPTIEVPERVEFGTVKCSQESMSLVSIHNAGGDSLIIEDISSNSPYFCTNFEDSLVLSNLDTVWVQAFFCPLDTGLFEGILTIVSNDPDGDATVLLRGVGEVEVNDLEYERVHIVTVDVDPDVLEFVDTPFDGFDSLMVLIKNIGTLPAEINLHLVGDPTFAIKGELAFELRVNTEHETWIYYNPSLDPEWLSHYTNFVVEVTDADSIIVSVRGTVSQSVQSFNLLLQSNYTTVSVFDLQGRRVGRGVSSLDNFVSGTYIICKKVDGVVQAQKVTLVK